MKRFFTVALPALALLLFLAALAVGENRLSLLLTALCVLALLPFFLRFERKETDARKAVLLAAFVAMSIAGRVLFTPFPSFKPVAAMVALCGAFFGGQAGFLCGALTALLSNFTFGQGPWTPFQMLSWGLIGLAAAYVPGLKKSPLVQGLFGVLSGIFYSGVMDLWTTVYQEGGFSLSRYLAYLLAALPVTVTYAVSNVLFLWALAPGMARMAERLGTKYGFTYKKVAERK